MQGHRAAELQRRAMDGRLLRAVELPGSAEGLVPEASGAALRRVGGHLGREVYGHPCRVYPDEARRGRAGI